MPTDIQHHASSFRDPAGYIFQKDGKIFRQVNKVYQENFDFFVGSGLYDSLVSKQMLIPHDVIPENLTGDPACYKTLLPQYIDFISYPYEWPFDMLKDAALLTLNMLKEGITWGMILKDATPYNIQWKNGKPVFIDTLSFEKYDESEPWIAYRQFCESFLSPLLLSHYSKQQLPGLMLAYPEGIPLNVTASLLPKRTRFSMHVYLHIHLQAKYINPGNTKPAKKINFSKTKLLNLVKSLEILIERLKLSESSSTWSGYYEEATQRDGYLEEKKAIIRNWLNQLEPKQVADLGANTGSFSMLAAEDKTRHVIATDFDPWCINRLYKNIRAEKPVNILPLVVDLSLPSPAIGLNNRERESFMNRLRTDLVMALALVHHLAIGKNIPFPSIAAFFNNLSENLIIEFVPKNDEKVRLMLAQKKDIYIDYTEANFEKAFELFFSIIEKKPVGNSGRLLYLLKKNER